MYFWRIERLKKDLTHPGLNDRDALPYLVVFLVLTGLAGYLPDDSLNTWDYASVSSTVVLSILGTLWLYWQNGAERGSQFLARYFSIGWVVLVRWLPIVIATAVGLYVAIDLLGTVEDDTTWYDFLLILAFEVVIYIRTGYHMRDVATRAAAA